MTRTSVEAGKNFQLPPMTESNAKNLKCPFNLFPTMKKNEKLALVRKQPSVFILGMLGRVIVMRNITFLNIPKGHFHFTDIHWA